MNGSDQERALMAVLRGHGFVPIRSPGSGTGDWDQPDVLAGQQGVIMAGELKSGGPPSNVQNDEVEALDRFADAFWAASLVVVRYKGDRTFYLVPPDEMSRTPSDHFSIPSSQSDLPWVVGLPYTRKNGGIRPTTCDEGKPRVLYASDEVAPSLGDWLQAVTARQQGFQVRQGIVDLNAVEHPQDGDADV